jgi:hypothetical protein
VPDVPPPIGILNLIMGKWVAQALYVAAKLGIADLLKDGPRPCDELARANQVDTSSLYRILRALASVGVFAEEGDRRFALTPMAECLRSDVPGSLRSMAIMGGEEWHWRPWGDILASVKTGERAFDRLYGSGLFEYLGQDPGAAAVFDGAMTGWSGQTASAVAAAYDFSGIGTLVDVGGGQGKLIATLLKANPGMKGILYDLPQVMDGAREALASEGVADRCRAVGGSFFEEVPEGGDAYVLRHIIHDWADEPATTILANCRRAMGGAGRILLLEMVIPPGNDPDLGKKLDLEMLVMAGGRERTEAEYRDLLSAAGFRLERIVPTPSPLSVIEGRPA